MESSMADWTELSALKLAANIRERQISSEEVVRLHIDRIQRVNPRINAVVFDRFEAALEEAEAKAEAEREAAWGAPPPSSQYRNDYGEEWSDEDEYEYEKWDDSIPGEYERNPEEDYSDEEW